MTLKDQRIEYLRKQLDAHGFACERKQGAEHEVYQFVISQNPEIEVVLSKELLEDSSWLFTEKMEEAINTATEARRKNRGGMLTMNFLDVEWHPNPGSP
jgi:hypothetical protein